MVEKKSADYTASAVNLCNPPELQSLLTDLAMLEHREAVLQAQLHRTELYTELVARQGDITACRLAIREAIDAYGSYQNLALGDYAIKQRKVSISYVVSRVKEFLRTYADAVIEEVVNKSRLEGLRKGGLVSQADLDRCAETTESFSYIIKVADTQLQQDFP